MKFTRLEQGFHSCFQKFVFFIFQQNSVFLAKTTKYTQYFVVSVKKQQITLLSAHKIFPPDVTFKENALTETIPTHLNSFVPAPKIGEFELINSQVLGLVNWLFAWSRS